MTTQLDIKTDFNTQRIIVKAPILTCDDYVVGVFNDLIEKFLQVNLRPILFTNNTQQNYHCPCIKDDLTFVKPTELVNKMICAAKDHDVIVVSGASFDDAVGDYNRLTSLLDIIDQTNALKSVRIVLGMEVGHLTKPFLSGTIDYFFRPTPEQQAEAEKFDLFCEKRNYHIVTIGKEFCL